MKYLWIVFAILSLIIILSCNKKVNKAMYPSNYKKPRKKPLRENYMMNGALIGLFVGVVASAIKPDSMALCLSACFFVGTLFGVIFKKKTYVESMEEFSFETEGTEEESAKEEAPAKA